MKTASPVQLGSFVNGYKGHFREQNGLGRPPPPVAPAPAPVPVVVPPRLSKSQKERLNNVLLFLHLMLQLGKVLGTLCSRPIGLDESVLEKIREKIPAPPPVEKKKERHLADLRDKRDKAQRVLDRLVEDAEKKRVLHEEACAKVNSQREELDDIVRQVDAARVQVNLPTLPSDDGDWEQGEESGVEGSEDEARRDVEAGLGMDVDGSSRKRGRQEASVYSGNTGLGAFIFSVPDPKNLKMQLRPRPRPPVVSPVPARLTEVPDVAKAS